MNKYNSQKTIIDGEVYDSRKEAYYGQALFSELKSLNSKILSIERQVPFPIEVNGVHICTYKADYVVTPLTGKKEIHEVKGFETPVFKLKWKLMKVLYPEYKFIII